MRLFLLSFVCGAALMAQDAGTRSSANLHLADVIRSTLGTHPLLDIQKDQAQISRAMRMQASGAFDLQLNSSMQQYRITTPLTTADRLTASQAGINTDHLGDNLSQALVGVDKLLRSGVMVSPSFTMLRNVDNITAANGTNTSHSGIRVVVPMLRGKGYAAVGAREIAGDIEIEAADLDLSHTAARLIASSSASYWNYLAAKKLLEIAAGSQERGRSFVENVQAFIDADRSPRSDLDEVKANYADRTSTRIDAEQRVIAARTQLAYDMGLTASDIDLVGEPVTEFPTVGPPLPADVEALDFYISEAFRRRADFLAAGRHVRSAEALRVSARNAVKPQVNLTFSAGYTGLHEGTVFGNWWQSPFLGVRGIDISGGVIYSFAPANKFAQGQLLQAAAQTRQAEKRVADLRRSIRASLLSATEAVRQQGRRVDAARQAVEAFHEALGGQREKYRLGVGSVIDILTLEDRLTNALANEVQAKLSFALALTDFRFGSGTILAPNSLAQTIDEQVMMTLPFDAASVPSKSTDISRSESR